MGKAAEEIAKSFAAFGIGEAGDDFGRLVEKEIDLPLLFAGDFPSGDLDFVCGGIRFAAEFANDFAVYADLAGEDELFGVATGGNAGASDDFL